MMNDTLMLINDIISKSEPHKYDNVSYTTYYNSLTKISTSIIKEKDKLKSEILKIEDEKLRLKLLELL